MDVLIFGSLIYNVFIIELFNKNKAEPDESDIQISLVYLSNKWWEV